MRNQNHNSTNNGQSALQNSMPIEKYFGRKLITVSSLHLVGHVQDITERRWIEARSKFKYIAKDRWVRVVEIDKRRNCLIVVEV